MITFDGTPLALIAADRSDVSLAKEHARLAIKAADRNRSDFRFHPAVGIVTQEYEGIVSKLRHYIGFPKASVK